MLILLAGGCATVPPAERTAESLAQTCTTDPPEYLVADDSTSGYWNVQASCGVPGVVAPATLTACIQAHLDTLPSLTSVGARPVVYFPASATPYILTKTLDLTATAGITLLGEDPATTTLVWGGPATPPGPDPLETSATLPSLDPNSMLLVDSSTHVRVSRLTFDGNTTARACIRVASHLKAADGKVRYQAGTAAEYSDLVLENARYGIRLGLWDAGNDDHNTVRRTTFRNLTTAGFSTEAQNLYPNDIWDSVFDHCQVGASNAAGYFNVWNSYFRGSIDADVRALYAGDFILQGNTSIGSRRFFEGIGDASVMIVKNHLQVTSSTAIQWLGAKVGLIIDNDIVTAPVPAGSPWLPIVAWQPQVMTTSGLGPGVSNHIITGNHFSVAKADELCGFATHGADLTLRSQCYTPSQSAEDPLRHIITGGYFFGNCDAATCGVPVVTAPTMPSAPLAVHAAGWLLPCTPAPGMPGGTCAGGGDDGDAIQAKVTALSALAGHPVLHLRAGLYWITKTIQFPPGSQVQILGDGATDTGTILYWAVQSSAANADDYVFDLADPARGTIQDVEFQNVRNQISTIPSGRIIRVHSPEHGGTTSDGVVYLDQVRASEVGNVNTQPKAPVDPSDNVGFFSSGVDHRNVQCDGCGFGGGDYAIRIVGSGAGQSGMGNVSAFKFLNLAASALWKSEYDLQSYANLYVAGLDSESSPNHGMRFGGLYGAGSGRFTVALGKLGATGTGSAGPAPPPDYGKIVVDSFTGDVSFFGLDLSAPIHVTAAADMSASVVAFGNHYTNVWNWTGKTPNVVGLPSFWNPDGPASPSGSGCMDPSQSPPCMTYSLPEIEWVPVPPTFLDCAGYQGLLGPAPYDKTDVLQPITGKGIFYADHVSAHAQMLNNTMWDFDTDNPASVSAGGTSAPCADSGPPSVAPLQVTYLTAGLTEIRAANVTVPRPCNGRSTDARFHRIAISSRFIRTAFAIVP